MKRDWDSEFAYIRYLSLITGEGARQVASKRDREQFSTGPRDWKLTWDLELSVWDFVKRPPAETLRMESRVTAPQTGKGAA